jgi:hypothetical protein
MDIDTADIEGVNDNGTAEFTCHSPETGTWTLTVDVYRIEEMARAAKEARA